MVRAKGVVWLSHDMANAFEFSIAGGEVSLVPFGRWLAAQTKQELELNGQREEYCAVQHLQQKDRIIELVIIGVDMDRVHIEQLLDKALTSMV